MLISLTNQCFENCSHCLVPATPDGPHMADNVFKKAVDFTMHSKVHTLIISGGEITCHPDFFDLIRYAESSARKNKCLVILMSNGSFIEDDAKSDLMRRLLSLPAIFALQITTDKRYYPNFEKTIANKAKLESLSKKVKVFYPVAETGLQNLGRAQSLEFDRKRAPSCTNFVLTGRQVDTWKNVIQSLEKNAKFCIPYISPDGEIRTGESNICTSLGNVCNSDDNSLKEKLNYIKLCDRCNQCRNIPIHIRSMFNL